MRPGHRFYGFCGGAVIFFSSVLIASLGLRVAPARAGTLDPALMAQLNRAPAGSTVSALVTLSEQLDAPSLEQELRDHHIHSRWRRHEYVVRRAQDLAARTQGALLARLEADRLAGTVASYRPFWITNAVAVEARPAVLTALALRGDVGTIYRNAPIDLRLGSDDPLAAPEPSGGLRSGRSGPRTLLDPLVCIDVQPAWDLGYTGAGRLVCDFDTGADGSHYAFASRWRGAQPGVNWWEAWKDPYGLTQFPYDSQSHGTHTLGIMVANPSDSVMIGVAPDAQWIAAGILIGWDVQKVIDCYQWAVDPDGDPTTIDDVPDVINNSWGTSDNCDSTFWGAIDVVEAAGIVNTIAVDNTGPNPYSVNSPESRAATDYVNFGVGNVDPHTDGYPISYSSGRGPSPCDSVSVKPNITAPGTTILSTIPGGLYTYKSGCSMACPHTSGAAAILRQVNPSLTVDQVKQAMMLTAVDHGDPGPDNTYGWGILDVGAAVQWVLQNYPPPEPPLDLSGTVTADSVLLSWTPPAHIPPADPVSGYNVYRAYELGPFPDTPLATTRSDETTYLDTGLSPGHYRYVVTTVYDDQTESDPSNQIIVQVSNPTSTAQAPPVSPDGTDLEVHPNPFSAETSLTLRQPAGGTGSIELYNAAGERVRTLQVRPSDSGVGSAVRVSWDGRDDQGRMLAAGAYFAVARGADGTRTRRVVLLH